MCVCVCVCERERERERGRESFQKQGDTRVKAVGHFHLFAHLSLSLHSEQTEGGAGVTRSTGGRSAASTAERVRLPPPRLLFLVQKG